MRNELCLWCGVKVILIETVGGAAIAVQCPLCLDKAPYGQPCGKKKALPPEPKYVPAGVRRERAKAKKAKAARQLELFKK